MSKGTSWSSVSFHVRGPYLEMRSIQFHSTEFNINAMANINEPYFRAKDPD